MSFCKPASEINTFKFRWVPEPLAKIYGDYSVEEFVLAVRNGSINDFMYSDEHSDAEKLELASMVEDVKETLTVNGFMRPEMMSLNDPELYFVVMYLMKLEIADNYYLKKDMEEDFGETFMPYYYSNDEYENYVFCYERVEAIINVLSNFLDEEELYEVTLDIMYMDEAYCETETLENAKKRLVEKGDELIPLLEQVFAMY